MTRKTWSKAQSFRLKQMKAAEISGKEMADTFGVTIKAVENKLARIRKDEAKAAEESRRRYAPRETRPAGVMPKQCWERSGEAWSAEENMILLTRGDKGDDFSDIGIDINRSRWACKVQYNALKRGTKSIIGIDKRFRRAEHDIASAAQAARLSLPSHKSITAFVFGDPLPGRSALDQLKQEGRRI